MTSSSASEPTTTMANESGANRSRVQGRRGARHQRVLSKHGRRCGKYLEPPDMSTRVSADVFAIGPELSNKLKKVPVRVGVCAIACSRCIARLRII
jgi:hypothetical protein